MLRLRENAEMLPFGDSNEKRQSKQQSRYSLSPPKSRYRSGIIRRRAIYISLIGLLLLLYLLTTARVSKKREEVEGNTNGTLTLQDRWKLQRDKWLAQPKIWKRPTSTNTEKKSSQMTRVGDGYKPNYAASLMELYRRFPNTNGSEYSFSQMAFQTNLYAQILRDDSLDEETLSQYESNLWSFFIPGINKIRKSIVLPTLASGWYFAEGQLRRGIVMSTNEGRVKFACHFLAILRQVYKSDLPVEIFHYGAKEMPANVKLHLQSNYEGVSVIDLQSLDIYDETFIKLQDSGWATKAFALMASSFQEVIMADDDAVFLINPEDLFKQKAYKQTGTLFYRDRYLPTWKSERGIDFIKQQLGDRQPSEMLTNSKFWQESLWHQQESGVVVLNRSKAEVFSASLFIAWANSFPIRNAITYDYFYGDKESFWLAFELAGFPYHMSSHDAGLIGDEHADFADGYFCTDKPLHFLESDEEIPKEMEKIPDPTLPGKTLGLPAWFNGSLKANKHRNGDKDIMMEVSKSTWALDGSWQWNENGKCLCLHNYTRGKMTDFGLDLTISKLAQVGLAASSLYEESRKVSIEQLVSPMLP